MHGQTGILAWLPDWLKCIRPFFYPPSTAALVAGPEAGLMPQSWRAGSGRQTADPDRCCYASNNDWIARAKEIHTWFRPELVWWRFGSNIGMVPRCVRGWKIGGRNAQLIPTLVLMCAYAYRGDAEIM